MTDTLEIVQDSEFRPLSYSRLRTEFPTRSPAVIDGILREGCVGTLVSTAKGRKSWAVGALIAAALKGGEWFGHRVSRGRVLLIDGELQPASIHCRLGEIFTHCGVPASAQGHLDVFPMRGQTLKIRKAMRYAKRRGPGYYTLIIIDPISCFYPADPRFDENSNACMRRLIDAGVRFATELKTAVMIVHHTSKGAQNAKSVIDLGAGAGAIVRGVDAHLVIRAHQEPGSIVFDGVVRDFEEIVPSCWTWHHPRYVPADGLDPKDLASPQRRRGADGNGASAAPKKPTLDEFVVTYLTHEPSSEAQIQLLVGEKLPRSNIKEFLKQGLAAGKIITSKDPKDKRSKTYSRPPACGTNQSPNTGSKK